MNREVFEKFLERLSPDREEAGRRYVCLQKMLVGFFTLKGISDRETAAADTLDRAAVRIIGGAPVPNVDAYCRGIARNVAMERRRREQRESSVFRRFVERLDDGGGEELESVYGVMKSCFGKLADEEQELLVSYCRVFQGRARAEHRRRLAEAMNTTVLALRMRVSRLRILLNECARKGLGEG